MPVDAEPKICSRCLKHTKLNGAEYCSRCLVEVIEKRVKRKLSLINSSSRKPCRGRIIISCDSKKSLSCAVAAYLAKKLRMAASVSVIKQASQRSKIQQRNIVIMPKCADETATNFLEMLIGGASFSSSCNTSSPDAADATNIFESITEKELALYADIKRIKYTKAKSSGLKQKIQELQAKHQGIIEAFAKSGRQLGGL